MSIPFTPNWSKISKSAGYLAVYAPDHPRAWKTGWIHLHRILAEMAIGRLLEPGEVVHHKDGNKLNNAPSNLEVLQSHAVHATRHHKENPGFAWPKHRSRKWRRRGIQDGIQTNLEFSNPQSVTRPKRCRKAGSQVFAPVAQWIEQLPSNQITQSWHNTAQGSNTVKTERNQHLGVVRSRH